MSGGLNIQEAKISIMITMSTYAQLVKVLRCMEPEMKDEEVTETVNQFTDQWIQQYIKMNPTPDTQDPFLTKLVTTPE